MRRSSTRGWAVLWLMLFAVAIGAAGAVPVQGQTPAPAIFDLTLGASEQGRPITAVRIGTGPRKLVLIGDAHGFPEANTYQLTAQLVDYFRAHPEEIPPELSFYLLPTVNPDGLQLQSRLNARGVDLNRNMDTSADTCPENDWRPVVAGAYGIVSPTGGPYPESEAESRLVRDFLLDANGVVFFHSNAGVVFPACGHEPSTLMGQVFADAAGYQFIPVWDRYAITGGMHDWAGGLGIAAVTPELITGDLPEFEQNLAGVQALLSQAAGILPEAGERPVAGVQVQPIIWRAWRAWGAERIWGNPVAQPVADGRGGWSQLFENGLLQYHPERSGTTAVVQVALLGSQQLGGRVVPREEPSGGRFFAETGHGIGGVFEQFWTVYGGLPIFGLPLTGEETGTDAAGRPIVTQTFERTVLERPAGAEEMAAVRLRPLGRLHWAQVDARSPAASVQAR